MNTKFEAYKLQRALKRSGIEYDFERFGKNEFDELNEEVVKSFKIKGLYHEQNGYITITTGDAAKTRTKKTPMILCLYEDVVSSGLKVGDFVKINNKVLKVNGVVNVQEWNIISDISLEFIDEVVVEDVNKD